MLRRFIVLALFAGCGTEALESAEGAATTCSFTVKGKIAVEHQLSELAELYGTSPLAGVKVKVSGKTWGTFASWGELVTDPAGGFSITQAKSCADREFKVEVKMQSSALEVRHELATSSLTQVKWYTISDSGVAHGAGTTDLGTLTFRAGGPKELGADEPRAHADIWVLYNLVIDELASYGPAFAFTEQVKVKYPHDSWLGGDSEASYANPITNVVYIHKDADDDDFVTSVLIHELMHVWAYEHSTGEDGLATYLVTHGTTHGLVQQSYIAFHEGFAKFASECLREIFFAKYPWRPLNRERLTYGPYDDDGDGDLDPITTLDQMNRHSDAGWYSAFQTLTQPELYAYEYRSAWTGAGEPEFWRIVPRDVGALERCAAPSLEFEDALEVFLAHPDKGYPAVIGTAEESLTPFFARAAAILPGLTPADTDAMLELIDPASTVEPKDRFCSTLTVAIGR